MTNSHFSRSYPRIFFMVMGSLLMGCLLYRYYTFAVFAYHHNHIVNEIKRVSSQLEETLLKAEQSLKEPSYGDPLKIVISVEKD